MTGLVRVAEDFIIEDREVQSQAKPDGVCWLHLIFANFKSVLVRLLGVFHCIWIQKGEKTQHNAGMRFKIAQIVTA